MGRLLLPVLPLGGFLWVLLSRAFPPCANPLRADPPCTRWSTARYPAGRGLRCRWQWGEGFAICFGGPMGPLHWTVLVGRVALGGGLRCFFLFLLVSLFCY
ncbi:hypothetical protein GCM10010171_10080 [Actinokineospora fastidiosa]|uniref:Uncharacterized protein n=1 Tax=Actinokineospora fastidiosa TaxID=1816 RepID=A0A918G583_9PSEU|nr:hypothetical protein GCM10010171_10080 [Actinokineospora fastidiosa]